MTTFVLVPGAGGAPWVWSRVLPLLERAGHVAVPVDLPGDDPTVDLAGYVERVVAAAEGRPDVVLVGQSFGGFSASAAVPQVRPRGLVLLNAMIPRPGESGADWWRTVDQAGARRANEAAAGRDPDRPFDPVEVFFHDAPQDVLAEAATHDRDQTDLAFRSPWPLDAWPDVPVRVLAAEDDRLFPVALQARVARERLGADLELVPGGHLCSLTRPAELAAALLRSDGGPRGASADRAAPSARAD